MRAGITLGGARETICGARDRTRVGCAQERDAAAEAGAAHGPLRSQGPPKENSLDPHLLEDIKKRRRKIKTKKEAETKENDQPVRRRRAKIKKRSGSGSPRVIRM